MPKDWATLGVDLHLELGGGGRRAALERALRDAILAGRVSPGSRLPSTRALSGQLGLARGTVSAAYDQLVAEGYLVARAGSGTVVVDMSRALPPAVTAPPDTIAPRYDLRPGRPDVTSFPVAAWLRSARRALAVAPPAAYDYGEPAGAIALRTALAGYLGRARGVRATPAQIVITSGYVQALSLLTAVLGAGRAIAMEDPCLAFHRNVVRRAGARVVPLPVDRDGARTDLLPTTGAAAAVLTPAHQFPLGMTLHPRRRHAAVEWARTTGGVVIEDDYDGEFRYDRQPVGAMQGIAPQHVAYVGTASKTLGPALRLAWLVLPEPLVEKVSAVKRHADLHSETIGQLTLADLIATHTYDRHIRACRLRYRRRRDLLVDRLASVRHVSVEGIAAGLHVVIRLPGSTEQAVLARAAARGLAIGGLHGHWHTGGEHPAGLVAGYGGASDGTHPAALDLLVRVLRTLDGPDQPRTP